MHTRTLRLAVALAAAFAVACCLPAAVPAQARWSLREDLRIGSSDEGPTLFTDIRGIAVGEHGAILVLDFKTQEIRMFDARGKFLKRVARQGSGPGEIRNANGMQMAPDGSIWVKRPGQRPVQRVQPRRRIRPATPHADLGIRLHLGRDDRP
jgi:hypothetical protein